MEYSGRDGVWCGHSIVLDCALGDRDVVINGGPYCGDILCGG